MPLMETIVAPFVNDSVTPTPFEPPGQTTVPPVILSVGLKGGTKTYSTEGGASQSYTMGAVEVEDNDGGSGRVNSVTPPPKTLKIHKVRCRNPRNHGMWADVVVVDAIATIKQDGDGNVTHEVYELGDAIPCIIDPTGDYGPVGDPQNGFFTRLTEIQRVTNPVDPNYFFDVEVLLALAVYTPQGQACFTWPASAVNAEIIDPTGKVGAVDIPFETRTRVMYVQEIDALASPTTTVGSTYSEQKGYPTGPVQKNTSTFILQIMAITGILNNSQPIAFVIPLPTAVSGLQTVDEDMNFGSEGQGDADIEDTTNYTVDSQGNLIPPDNTDINPYVVWPKETKGPWLGPKVPISQGMLWWIEGLSAQPPSGPIGGFPFTCTVDLWWGATLTGGDSYGGPLSYGATYQFALATYRNGDGPKLGPPDENGIQNIIVGDPLHIEYGPTFQDGYVIIHGPNGGQGFAAGYIPPGSCSLTVTGHEGDDTSPGGNTPVFLMQFLTTQGYGLNGFYAWQQYTATATDIPSGTEMSYPGVQEPTFAPETITIGSPPAVDQWNSEASNPPPGQSLPQGAFIGGFASAGSVDVDFLSIAPADRMKQDL